jgi:hypothetical protein
MGHARESLKVVTMGKFLEKNFSGEEIFYFLEDSAPLIGGVLHPRHPPSRATPGSYLV